MNVGMKVTKPNGYPFPGTIVARFQNLAGDVRLVVESELAPGMLHIFSEKQLEPAPEEFLCPRCRHAWKHHEQYVARWFTGGEANVCLQNMGQGDPCCCEEKVNG